MPVSGENPMKTPALSTSLYRNLALIAAMALSLSACGSLDRISNIGKAPDLSPIENQPVAPRDRNFERVAIPMPAQSNDPQAHNSLWQAGTRHFFKDPRAAKIGDILTVRIDIEDKARVDNSTTRSRDNNNSASIPSFPFGLDKAGNLVELGSTTSNGGSGTVDRSEAIELTVAAIVTNVLPNGNLIIRGKQEVRVNFEVRDLTIQGIVRPEDITAQNTINHTQIAEARVSYGGRGQITDLQQPPYGQQLYEILMPF